MDKTTSLVPASEAEDNWRSSFRYQVGHTAHRIASQLSSRRVWLLAIGHAVVFTFVYWLAFALRFDFAIPDEQLALFWATLPWILGVKTAIFFVLGHYDGWWSYVTFADLAALLRAAVLSLLVIAGIDLFFVTHQIPRGVLILDCGCTIMVLGAMRASWRLFREQFRPMINRGNCRWALLVGADHENAILAHQIQSHYHLPYQIRGFLSTNGARKGSRLGQIPVLGSLEDIREIAKAARTTDVLVIAGSLPGRQLRSLMEACDEENLNLKIIPPIEDRLDGDHRIPIRDIEINDLLRRDPVKLDTQAIGELLQGRTVMVTGAGGSIGSEICRQVLRFNPKSLILVGRGENRIFAIERELRTTATETELHTAIADVTDKSRVRKTFQAYRPEVVFHAAAHKHVPLMEQNVGEAIKNNVCGTKTLAHLADEFGVLGFVFISTDKAVHPTSVMGVSKQIAERYIHAMQQRSTTRYMVVRFGNVLGSAGSVVPVFQEQIRSGGPITVTDAQMTRFFMTIPEASQLVLQAAAMGKGGEIFVLEMGDPVRIVDLARDLIRLSGLPGGAIEIVFTGVRPGEKLYEELYFDDEKTLPTSHPKVRAAYHRPYSLQEVQEAIAELERLVYEPDDVIRQRLHELVPEYAAPSENADTPRQQPPPPEMHRMESHA